MGDCDPACCTPVCPAGGSAFSLQSPEASVPPFDSFRASCRSSEQQHLMWAPERSARRVAMLPHRAAMSPLFGQEKMELQELNRRLELYLARVWQLEQENGLMLEEIRRLRCSREDGGWLQGYREEAQRLRNRLQELSLDKCRTELQLYDLGQERELLQGLCGEVRAIRAQLDAELRSHRRDLERARKAEDALRELLLRLQAERSLLEEAQERDVLELRERIRLLLVLPAQRPADHGLLLQEVQNSALLLLSEAWEETSLQYERRIEELQLQERADRERQEQAAEERELCAQQARELARKAQELQALRRLLEDELLAMQERYRQQVHDYQVMIESLEEEKRSLDLNFAERWRDYDELMQVKSGLSLEVAAYRALLEGENNREKITWTEQYGRKIPAGVRTFVSEHSNKYSAHRRENEKMTFPVIRRTADARPKGQISNISSSAPYLNMVAHAGPPTTPAGRVPRKDMPSSSYHSSAVVKEESSSYERAARTPTGFRKIFPRYDFVESTDIRQKRFPEIRRREITISASLPLAKESTIHIHTLDRDQGDDLKLDRLNEFPDYELKTDFIGKRYEQSKEKIYVTINQTAKKGKPDNLDGKMVLNEKTKEDKAIENERETTLEEKTMVNKSPREKEYVFEISNEAALATDKNGYIQEETIEDKPVKQAVLFIWEEANTEDELPRKEKNVMLKGQSLEEDITRQTYVVPEEQVNDYELSKDNESFTVKEMMQEMPGYEIPVILGDHIQEQVSQKNSIEGVFSDLHPEASRATDSSGDITKPTEATVIHSQGKDTKGSEKKTSWKENLGENLVVADILKEVDQPASLERSEGAKVTYIERKEQMADGAVKTEITVQSTMEENEDLTDKTDLEALLSRHIKKMIPEDLRGMAAEGLIENIIYAGLKGKEDVGRKSVNVEIVEEPLESVMDEKSEVSIPFQVEEVDDACPNLEGNYAGGDIGEALTAGEMRSKMQPSEDMRNIEEVTEDHDTAEQLNYIVSTPDDYPVVHDQEDDSLFGQIHIEEESTIKYSWHDEVSQSTQSKRSVSGLHEYDGLCQSEIISKEGDASTYTLRQEQPKEETSHREAVVTEREIRIPHDFQTSIMELLSQETKDPKYQLKGTLEQLQGGLPESLKEELSALTSNAQTDSDKMAVDIKKVEQTADSGVVTIVAEINISQKLNPDHLDALQHTHSAMNEMASLQSLQGQVSENLKNQQIESTVDSGNYIEIDTSSSNNQSMPCTIQEFYSSSTLKGSDGLECHTAEQVIRHPVSETEFSPTGHDSWVETSDSNRFIRHIKLGPSKTQTTEQIIFEGPISEVLDASVAGGSSPNEGFTDISRSVKHIKLGPKEIHTTEEIIFEGPISKMLKVGGGTADLSQTEDSSNANTSISHISIGPTLIHTTEHNIFEGPISEMPEISDIKGSTDVNRSIRHITLGSREIQTTERIVFEGPSSENFGKLNQGGISQTEAIINSNSSTGHFKLSPQEIQTTEYIIVKEPISEAQEFCVIENLPETELSTDMNRSTRHIKLGSKQIHNHQQTVYEDPISTHLQLSGADLPQVEDLSDHFQLSPKDIHNINKIIFEEPIFETPGSSDTEDLSQSKESTDINVSIRHIKLNAKELHSPEIVFEKPSFEMLGSSDTGDHSVSKESTEINRSVETFGLGGKEFWSTENIFEEPSFEMLRSSDTGDHSVSEESTEINSSVETFELGGKEFQFSEIIFEEPSFEMLGSSDTGDLSVSEEPIEINRSVETFELGGKEFQSSEIIFEEPSFEMLGSSDTGDLSVSEESTEINRSVETLELGGKEFQSSEIIFEEPNFEMLGSSDTGAHSVSEDSTEINRSVKTLELGGKEFQSSEIIFEEPCFEMLGSSDSGDHSVSEESMEINRSIRHTKLGPKEFWPSEIIFEGPISEILGSSETPDHFQSEESMDSIQTSDHFKLNPEEFHSSEIIFEEPISETLESSDIEDPSQIKRSTDINRSVKHIKLGPNEKSFTFQMDVTKFTTMSSDAAGVQEHSMVFSTRKLVQEPEVSWIQSASEGNQKGYENENVKDASADTFSDSHEEDNQACEQKIIDMSVFDKTVQLQRMVDQRAVISDQEKIAVIYLDKEDNS